MAEITETVDMAPEGGSPSSDGNQTAGVRELVARIAARVRGDREFHSDAFKVMREDMCLARRGALPDWPEDHYTANITGRHINQKVSALYAKDPKAAARRRPRLDFAIWDEDETTLQQAVQVVQAGMAGPVAPDGTPFAALDPMYQQAMALVQDVQEGMQRREITDRTGKTLEVLFDYFTKEQTPVDFKTSMKQLVRRTSTTGVGYLKIGFQREHEQVPQVAERLADFRSQLAHLEHLAEGAEDQSDPQREEKQAELQASIKSLQEQEYVVAREGLVFDFPDSTRVIPDRLTKNLTGFVGSRWVTVEYLLTPDEVKKMFGVDLGKEFKEYSQNGTIRDAEEQLDMFEENKVPEKHGMACVWEHYDRESGVVYYLCDGHKSFLREPSAPDVYVEDFWPVFALVFNEVEDEEGLYPPSDVRLIKDMQADYNRSRQGQREHRRAARPRFVTPKGALDDQDKEALGSAEPFSVTEVNPLGDDLDVRKLVQAIQIPGVDPNLYETGQTMTDIQLVAGAQEAQFGAVAKATATESSIAESSRIASVDSNVDDLDSFLTRVSRASGQVMLREMSVEQVVEIVGPGAVWPNLTLDQIAKEVLLEIEAGSSGRPNQVQEIRNWQNMLPHLIQMPNLSQTWLVRETLRRLDDRLDLTQAIVEGTPSIMAMNGMTQPAPQDPGNAPDAQGAAGAQNAPAAPGGEAGTDAAMGNNQVL